MDPAKAADIRRLLALTGSANVGKQVALQLMAQLREVAPEVPEAFWQEFAEGVDVGELVELVIPVYDRNFTHEDIRELIRFYESPIGRKVSATLPAVARESMEAGQAWGREIAVRARRRAHERRLTDKSI